MPRYFFHVCDEAKIEDKIGVVLPGLEEAKREAARAVEIAKILLPNHPFKLVVTDQSGQEVFHVNSQK
jgi:hypothetical protein